MRRLLWIAVCMCFALSLNASVPANPNSGLKRAVSVPFATPDRTLAGITTSPVDGSFFTEFYPTPSDDAALQSLQPKSGMLHKLASLFKKAVKFRL